MTPEQLERWLWNTIQWLKRINHPARPALLGMWCWLFWAVRDAAHWDLSHPGQPSQGWAGVRALLTNGSQDSLLLAKLSAESQQNLSRIEGLRLSQYTSAISQSLNLSIDSKPSSLVPSEAGVGGRVGDTQ